MSRFTEVLLTLFCCLISALFGGVGIYLITSSTAASDWPTASGIVVESDVRKKERRKQDGSGSYSVYTPRVVYKYEVADKSYQCDRIGYDDYESYIPSAGTAFDKVKEYSVGKAVEVRYDPLDPSNATLETSVGRFWCVMFLISAVSGGIGSLMLVSIVRGKSLNDLLD